MSEYSRSSITWYDVPTQLIIITTTTSTYLFPALLVGNVPAIFVTIFSKGAAAFYCCTRSRVSFPDRFDLLL